MALREDVIHEKSHEGTAVPAPIIEDVSDLFETAATKDDPRNHFEISMHLYIPQKACVPPAQTVQLGL